MIRVLFGSTLSLLGLGVAASILGPDLLAGPRGEPIIMAAASEASLHAASFEGEACPSALLFAGPLAADAKSGAHIVAFALRSGERGIAVQVEDFAGGAQPPKTVVLIFDEAGHLVSVGDPESLDLQAAAKHADCAEPLETPRAPI